MSRILTSFALNKRRPQARRWWSVWDPGRLPVPQRRALLRRSSERNCNPRLAARLDGSVSCRAP